MLKIRRPVGRLIFNMGITIPSKTVFLIETAPSTQWVNYTHWGLNKMTDIMMTSSNGNIFRVTGPLCGEFTGHWWIPRTKASDTELWCFLWSAPWINSWVNNREAGDLRPHRTHYDVAVMRCTLVESCTSYGCGEVALLDKHIDQICDFCISGMLFSKSAPLNLVCSWSFTRLFNGVLLSVI